MRIRISRLHHPVTVLGPGRRFGVWFQGCTIGCAGCIARDTWEPDGGVETTVDAVLDALARTHPDGVEGVTVSGGEPFEQPEALAALIDGIRVHAARTGVETDVMVYSGRSLADLEAQHAEVVARIDVLVPEPYRPASGPGGAWRGSANQPLLLRTPLARTRYRDLPAADGHVQVHVADGRVWLIGVPRAGDAERLARRLHAAGLQLEGASWRP
jgi:anaerobic ribonucleoside-triphosphate reductase activating protein